MGLVSAPDVGGSRVMLASPRLNDVLLCQDGNTYRSVVLHIGRKCGESDWAFAFSDFEKYGVAMLKPQDLLVAIKLALWNGPKPTYQQLANELGLAVSEVCFAIRRAAKADLVNVEERQAICRPLVDFLAFGVRHCFPAEFGAPARGIATALSSPVAHQLMSYSNAEVQMVWPSPMGQVNGTALIPLHKCVPFAVQRDRGLYDVLALIDLIRVGRARERGVAIQELYVRMGLNVAEPQPR